ncbi:GNAT family N-acetyltransferase [Silicimonas sp. MF1-12-2]|uniref:GNAT family N-acetyltransferase n=1 Tax=Silicimonas sp. MF1-12-2 TaxID=3384793 RepID=UPI0039B61C75
MRPVKLRIDDTTQARWQALTETAKLPLQQSWNYGAAVDAAGGQALRIEVREKDRTIALAQGVYRRLGWPVTLITRGPVWIGNPDVTERMTALRTLRKGLKGLVLMTPDVAASDALRRAGFADVMTPSTMACLTLNSDLRKNLNGKWRNRLVRAETQNLVLERLDISIRDLRWLLEADARQPRLKGYRAMPDTFTKAWLRRDPRSALAIAASRNTERLAAMLFLRHGTTATYHIGWSSEDGRKVSAHNLLLWKAAQQLAAEGVATLDLGLIDTVNAPGLARFKLGTGARPVRTGGTWLGW